MELRDRATEAVRAKKTTEKNMDPCFKRRERSAGLDYGAWESCTLSPDAPSTGLVTGMSAGVYPSTPLYRYFS